MIVGGNRIGLFFLPLLLAVLLFSFPVTGFAADANPNEMAQEANDTIFGRNCDGLWVTQCLVVTIKTAVNNAAVAYLNGVFQSLATIITTAIVLFVTLYGVMLAMGAIRHPAKRAMMLLLKIAFILFFIQNFDDLYYQIVGGGSDPTNVGAIEGIANIVTSYTKVSNTLGCEGEEDLWRRIDCAFDSVIGIAPATGMISGILALLAASIFSSKVGILIFVLGMGFLLTLLITVARGIYIFVMAYVALAFMVAILPLFMPLVLFPRGMEYVKNWIKMSISFALQPIILFAYLSMMLAVFDVIVIGKGEPPNKNSLYNVIAPNMGEKKIGEYMDENNVIIDDLSLGSIIMDFDASAADATEETDTGLLGTMLSTPARLKEAAWDYTMRTAIDTGASVVGIKTRFKKVDYVKLAALAGGMEVLDYTIKVVLALMFCLVFVYVMNSMLKYIPLLANEIAGGYFGSPILARGGIPFESRISSVIKSAARTM